MYELMAHEQILKQKRLVAIRENLKPRGDIKAIAEAIGVRREWASKGIHGHGTSERVLQEAERSIESRIN